ncbi:hypothetical protein FIBSPDRAFT_935748 [Athelia psychrophila]|uniref:Fungal calcium binding protein domain-containing protein n=1 Tax=Athelia psychrophila TaxID=1759441 RepID=A0A166DCB0_9AGAM|nr:hypothetical protein FIBSPDRAFT_935746 [Fibularhizoctonia sp. CBS 109695]KZP14554.1 hypothetical protein FIBSPDRAFT_935748 [Fibularhizoctonia sp. CBS 109695]
MLFSTVPVFVAFAASALAARSTPSRTLKERTDCQIANCVAALAGTVIGCTAAALQEGLDPISDVSCLAAAVNTVLNFPASCDQCLEAYGINEPAAVSSAITSIESFL